MSNAPQATNPAASADSCPWYVLPGLSAEASWWEGHDASEGHVEINRCKEYAANLPGGVGVITQFVPNGAPAPLPDPRVLAQRVVGQVTGPKPTVGVGPDRTKMVVNLWTWL